MRMAFSAYVINVNVIGQNLVKLGVQITNAVRI